MASHPFLCPSLTLTLLLTAVVVLAMADPVQPRCYKSIFSFGDSHTDTGNTISLGFQPCTLKYPYGMTYFHRPNGRYCDGRIITDFIAAAHRLPFLPAYNSIKCGKCFAQGANFAVGGATVLNERFYEMRHFEDGFTKYSLEVQLGWFKQQVLPSLCNSPSACRAFLSSSLIFLGSIGGDDYLHPLRKWNVEEVTTIIPQVVAGISEGVKTLIDLGAVTIVVPGIFPMGCNTVALTEFATMYDKLHDSMGCLIWLNNIAKSHNDMLQKKLQRLRNLYTNVTIVYADYYGATIPFYQSPEIFGFKDPLSACCGWGGEYNYNALSPCGSTGSQLCKDPTQYVDWDGSHFTEKVYALITKSLLSGQILTPRIKISCSVSESYYNDSDQSNYI